MAINLSAVVGALRVVATHNVTKGAALSSLLVGGLYAVGAAGIITVAPWETALAGFAGTAIYHFLPPKDQALIDTVATDAVDIATTIPQTYSEPSDFPVDKETVGNPTNFNVGK